MKKVAIGIVTVLTVLFLGFGGLVMSQPGHVHVERSIHIDATAADIAPYAQDLKLANEWSPWDELDPNLKRTYSETTNAVGSTYAWEGNDDVGAGSQSIDSIEPGKVVHGLHFLRPMKGEATATLSWTEANGGLDVTWAYDQTADFGTKVAQVFMSFDELLGPDFDKGLDQLKPLVESAASARKEAEAKAAAAAEEAAAEGAEGAAQEEAGK